MNLEIHLLDLTSKRIHKDIYIYFGVLQNIVE